MIFNPKAPIIPFIGLGDIKLGCTRDELSFILNKPEIKHLRFDSCQERYEIPSLAYLFFNSHNNKLFKIATLGNYCGWLMEKVKVGSPESCFTNAIPDLQYDELEEVWISLKSGVFIETGLDEKALIISVFVHEMIDLPSKDFWDGKW